VFVKRTLRRHGGGGTDRSCFFLPVGGPLQVFLDTDALAVAKGHRILGPGIPQPVRSYFLSVISAQTASCVNFFDGDLANTQALYQRAVQVDQGPAQEKALLMAQAGQPGQAVELLNRAKPMASDPQTIEALKLQFQANAALKSWSATCWTV
jgi:hypothetical protein